MRAEGEGGVALEQRTLPWTRPQSQESGAGAPGLDPASRGLMRAKAEILGVKVTG